MHLMHVLHLLLFSCLRGFEMFFYCRSGADGWWMAHLSLCLLFSCFDTYFRLGFADSSFCFCTFISLQMKLGRGLAVSSVYAFRCFCPDCIWWNVFVLASLEHTWARAVAAAAAFGMCLAAQLPSVLAFILLRAEAFASRACFAVASLVLALAATREYYL